VTETQTTPRPPATIGRAVGMAEAALTRLLTDVLAETQTPRETYLAFQRLSLLGGAAPLAAYLRDLSDALFLAEAEAAALAGSLLRAGLIQERERDADPDPVVGFTDSGKALADRIARSVGRLAAEMVAPVDPGDIETTIRTLQAITQRARQLRSAGQEGALAARAR
jgi:DNA-binding MarR family transcriptional regulator